MIPLLFTFIFFFNDTATTEIYTLSLHDALPISPASAPHDARRARPAPAVASPTRSEEHTSELQSPDHLVCRHLLEKKKTNHIYLLFYTKKTKKKKLSIYIKFH